MAIQDFDKLKIPAAATKSFMELMRELKGCWRPPLLCGTMSKPYLLSILLTALVIPAGGAVAEHLMYATPWSALLLSKWFIFSAGGLRLLVAGIKQALDPAFTAKQIFHIQDAESLPIVRELGFANVCMGSLGVISLFAPGWRMAAAFACGLYFTFAALGHITKKPVGPNERLALWSDVLIAVGLVGSFIMQIQG